ncbi:hypothetical protein HDV01_007436 [Terramyces sp. JEL0728]|nr:hypothetical protein HDV01_007436 [Terramyces sp. JEL0728]
MNQQAYDSLNKTTIQAVIDHCRSHKNTIVEPIAHDKTLHETLEILQSKRITAIPVKKLEIIGIVSIADILNFILFGNKSDQVPIESILGVTVESSTNFILSGDTTIYVLIQLFTGQDYHHRALIKDETGVINMISQSDLMNFIHKNFKDLFQIPITRACRLYVRNPQLADPIGEAVARSPAIKQVLTVPDTNTALQTFKYMYEMNIGSVAIVNRENHIVESCSISDLEVLNVADVQLLSKNIVDFFQKKRNLATSFKGDLVEKAVHMMLELGRDRIWVVEDLKPVDILTVTDVLCLLRPNIKF